MEAQLPNPTKTATKWALIYLLTAIVITYAVQFSGVDPNSPIKYISFLPFILFLFLAQKEYRDVIGGYITFGDAFSAGFRYSIFAGLLLAVFTLIYLIVLSPDVLDKSLDTARAQLAEKGMSDAQIDKSMDIAKKAGPWIGSFVAAIMYAVFGAVISLIGAAIFKKERTLNDIAANAIDPTETTI